jgi:hypothetical protein
MKPPGGRVIQPNNSRSSFLLEYQQIIDGYAESVDYSSESDVTRCDADMTEFHLDQADVPGYFCEG